jgi:hypothetical protein
VAKSKPTTRLGCQPGVLKRIGIVLAVIAGSTVVGALLTVFGRFLLGATIDRGASDVDPVMGFLFGVSAAAATVLVAILVGAGIYKIIQYILHG